VKRSNRLVILVGVLLAVLAFVGIVIILNQQGTGSNGPEKATVDVLVAKNDIELGTPVTPDMVAVKQVAVDAVQGTPLHDPSQVGGRTALVTIPKDAQVPSESFGGVGVVDISASLKPGEKAVTLQLDRTTGVDFLVKRGDIIDIVLSEDVQVLQPTADSTDENPRFEPVAGLTNARTVKTVLQQKRVLYVSQSRATQTQASPSPGAEAAPPAAQPAFAESVIIVFAGTDQDAELVKFAQRDITETGSMTVTIRATADTAVEQTTGLTIDSLVKNFGLPIPGIVEQVGPSTAPASR
jgi:pilus assembly protein CpaB